MKVFLSQPMSGKSLEDIERERQSIKLPEESIVLQSVLKCSHNSKNKSVWYLAKSLEIMAEADVVFFMKGWEKARGCQIEHETAKQYGLQIMYEV